jgi:hypothetical protein
MLCNWILTMQETICFSILRNNDFSGLRHYLILMQVLYIYNNYSSHGQKNADFCPLA